MTDNDAMERDAEVVSRTRFDDISMIQYIVNEVLICYKADTYIRANVDDIFESFGGEVIAGIKDNKPANDTFLHIVLSASTRKFIEALYDKYWAEEKEIDEEDTDPDED